jgi:SAM-dependent methyltransferase
MAEHATSSTPARKQDQSAEYGPSYFLEYWGDGGSYERNDHWLGFFGKVADGIIRDFEPGSVLDAGCAMGFLVEALRQRGVAAAGIDISEYAISQVDESAASYCKVASLTEPLSERYDLITCIEVLEHLPPSETDKAIANLCGATDRLLISSTPGDFGEPTHLNVQAPETWSAKLAQEGFLRDLERDLSYISPWAAFYTRREEPLVETVRRYDRAWWRLRREVDELRASLLQTREQLSDRGDEEPSELRERMHAQERELLRLRDLLIGKDAELGSAKGRLAELEDRSSRIAGAKHRIESQLPGLRRVTGAALRLLRGRS